MQYMDGGVGRRLGEIYTGRLPVYEQTRFERRSVRGFATATGDGVGVATFSIVPPANEVLFIQRAWFEIGATALSAYSELSKYHAGGSLQQIRTGVFMIEASQGFQCIGPSNTNIRINAGNNNRSTMSEVRLYGKDLSGGPASDNLVIETVGIPGNTEVLSLMWEGEFVPPDGEMVNGDRYCSGTV